MVNIPENQGGVYEMGEQTLSCNLRLVRNCSILFTSISIFTLLTNCDDDDIDCKCVCVGWRVTHQTREGGDIQVVEV